MAGPRAGAAVGWGGGGARTGASRGGAHSALCSRPAALYPRAGFPPSAATDWPGGEIGSPGGRSGARARGSGLGGGGGAAGAAAGWICSATSRSPAPRRRVSAPRRLRRALDRCPALPCRRGPRSGTSLRHGLTDGGAPPGLLRRGSG